MNVVFFHGLESPSISDKSEYLENTYKDGFVWCPAMNYNKEGLFKKVLKDLTYYHKTVGIDYLVGSSMGGWFAYCLSTNLGIDTILFNPALAKRTINPTVSIGNKTAKHTIILGFNDNIIIPTDTIKWLDENKVNYKVHWESNGHRTPIDIFKKYI